MDWRWGESFVSRTWYAQEHDMNVHFVSTCCMLGIMLHIIGIISRLWVSVDTEHRNSLRTEQSGLEWSVVRKKHKEWALIIRLWHNLPTVRWGCLKYKALWCHICVHHHPDQCTLETPLRPPPNQYLPKVTPADLYYHRFVSSRLHCHINEIMWHVLFYVSLLSLNILSVRGKVL